MALLCGDWVVTPLLQVSDLNLLLKIFKNIICIYYLFLIVLSLCCCTVACSSCHAQVSHCAGFSCCGARPLGARASVVAVRGLSCSMVCGIFADQESNLYTFIHCTTRELYHQGTVPPGNCASRELYRQGSPYNFFFF